MSRAITATNVLGASEYKSKVNEVMEFAGKTVSRTIGPCANTSIIEEMGPLVSSKDGFHTMKRIMFAPSDTFARNIMNVMVRMSHRMVSLVGDGSSSAVVAAWKFGQTLGESNLKNVRPRTLNDLANKTIDAICQKIESNSITPSKEDMPDVMYKTAYVSSNGDEKFASMIKKIYEENESVSFSLAQGKRNETTTEYQVVKGYKASYYYMLDPIFHNIEGGFEGRNVYVIPFDMAITEHHYNLINHMASLAHTQDEDNRYPNEVVVVAPSFDQNFLDKINQDVRMDMQLMNAKQIRHIRIRYMKCLSVNQYQRNEYMDFCLLAGAVPVSSVDFNDMVDILSGKEEFDDERLMQSIGKVGHLRTHLSDYCIIEDFPKIDQSRFDITFNQVKEIYEKLAAENLNSPIPSLAFINQRQRYRKLLCRMVEITVGGPNEFETTLNYDAADDATKACESVARFGYNIGGNMAILLAVEDLIKENSDNDLEVSILKVIRDTFIGVVSEIFANKYTSDGFDSLDDATKNEITGIIDNCIAKRKYYDLISEEYTDDIVNSSRTDTEILRGALSLSLTLLTANQYVMSTPTNILEK